MLKTTPSAHHDELLETVLTRIRAGQFVGRGCEKALFESVIAPSARTRLIVVSGPGGIGKTSLLDEFQRIALHKQARIARMDARRLRPTPPAVEKAVQQALQISAPQILMIDTFETISVLDEWVREDLLPGLPAELRVVLAGRWRPGPQWLGDAGWSELIEECRLEAWKPAETREYLHRRGIDRGHHDRVHALVHGNPLAAALTADYIQRNPGKVLDRADTEVVIGSLVEQILQDLSSWQVLALQAATVSRYTTEPLLAAMLDVRNATNAFNWLSKQLFMERSRRGIFPHDLVRNAVIGDLVTRDYVLYQRLSYRAARHALRHIDHDAQRNNAVLDFTFALREEKLVKRMFTFDDAYNYYLDRPQTEDDTDIENMVFEYEGPESLDWLKYWRAHQPEGLWVVRDKHQHATGFLQLVTLDSGKRAGDSADPVVCGVHDYLKHFAPLRPGEQAAMFRFWMARDTYQTGSGVQSNIFAFITHHYLTTPRLAFTVSVHQDGAGTALMESSLAQLGIRQIREAACAIGGKRYTVWGYDWRLASPVDAMLRWIENVQRNEACPQPVAASLLEKDQFARAVHSALRHFEQDTWLRDNALLESRVFRDAAGLCDQTDKRSRLRATLLETARQLPNPTNKISPYQILDRSYFHPATKQRATADALNLSFGTYRRRLREAEQLLIERLWRAEVGHSNKGRADG